MLQNTYLSSVNQISSSVRAALSEWIYVSSTTLAAPAQNISVASLNGDVDENYRIVISAIAGTITASNVTATINNDGGANYTYQYLAATAAAAGARGAGQTSINTTILMLDSDNNANNNGVLEFILKAKTGTKRNYDIYGASGYNITLINGAYLETAANITRVDFIGSAADCFGTGTIIKVYKRAN
jgi:hypothetical protein